MLTYRNGRFGGKYDTASKVTLSDVVRWKLQPSSFTRTMHKSSLRVVRRTLREEKDFICWLSHASFLLDLGGYRILIDPVFGHIPFYKRAIPFPYTIPEMAPLSCLLLSHAHYDHLDIPSLKSVVSASDVVGVFPLKMGALFKKKVASIPIEEIAWFESYTIDDITITLVPARHWSRRGVYDTNRILWGGYVIEYRGKCIYFAGDTSYGDHFKEIGKRFKIDIALLPIGAYAPAKIMRHNHMNPEEAYQAFIDTGASYMIPMHYGTFRLSDEALHEPLEWMQKIAMTSERSVIFLSPGDIYRFSE